MNRKIFKDAVRRAIDEGMINAKSAPTLRRKPFELNRGQFHHTDNSVSLPTGSDMVTAVHEVRHSGDPHRKTLHRLVKKMNAEAGVNPELDLRRLKLAHRLIARSEARANAGLGGARTRHANRFYDHIAKSELGKQNMTELRQRRRAFNAAGGDSAPVEDKAWLKLSAALRSGNLRECAAAMDLVEGEWKHHKYIRKEGKRYIYKGGWEIPWVFSREDLVIPGNRQILITGLSGSGKTTDAKKYYPVKGLPVRHLDDEFKSGKSVYDDEALRRISRWLYSRKPVVIEGVQVPALFNQEDKLKRRAERATLRVKGTSFLKSILQARKRERGNKDDMSLLTRIRQQRDFKGFIDRMLARRSGDYS